VLSGPPPLRSPSSGADAASERIAVAALHAVLALRAAALLAFASAIAQFGGERFRTLAQFVEGCVLRARRAFEIAAPQRVFGPAHGLARRVEIAAGGC